MFKIVSREQQDDVLGIEWDYLARSFGLSEDQLIQDIPGDLPVIVVQPQDGLYVQGESSLLDFQHPDDCVYLFGESNGHLELAGVTPAAKVYIPHAPTWNLFASQAAAIVLWDRYVKRGGLG